MRPCSRLPRGPSAFDRLFLVLNRVAKEWRMPAREWIAAKAQFAILFENCFTTS
jgi:putative transposase